MRAYQGVRKVIFLENFACRYFNRPQNSLCIISLVDKYMLTVDNNDTTRTWTLLFVHRKVFINYLAKFVDQKHTHSQE